MKKWLRKKYKKLKKEIKRHKFIYFLLGITLLGGLFVRTYRTDQILGFYFDQGRDAIEIWEMWHEGDIMFIGPTTGIAGIFRGAFYYYLIAPFYLIGGGNPVVPAYFLAFLSMIAVVILYYLGKRIQDRPTGLFAAIIASFSFYTMLASRWLSNPTPMLLLSVILVWGMLDLVKYAGKKKYKKKKWWWPVIAFVSGASLFHFGSAGEVFYFPALLIFFVWVWKKNKWKFKKTLGWKYLGASFLAFFVTFLPLLAFDIKNNGILRENIRKFLVEQESFKASVGSVLQERIEFYYQVFSSKIFHWIRTRELVLLLIVAGAFFAGLPKLVKKDSIKVILLMFFAPIVGLLFFQGNFGNIYDYYLTGYYLIFILLFAIVLGRIWGGKIGKLFVIYFFFVFLSWNGEITKARIIAGVDGPETIAFGNQKQAIDWVYEDASQQCDDETLRHSSVAQDGDCIAKFNVDAYVPPVIPHAYDYLFTWYGGKVHGYEPEEEHVDLLYTLYEVDPSHPERLEAWMERQAGIGIVEEEESFGGITVQRRKRIGGEEKTN